MHVFEVMTVNAHGSEVGIVEAADEVDDGGFARAAGPDEADELPGLCAEGYALEDGGSVFVGKGDVLKFNAAVQAVKGERVGGVFYFGLGVQNFKDATR